MLFVSLFIPYSRFVITTYMLEILEVDGFDDRCNVESKVVQFLFASLWSVGLCVLLNLCAVDPSLLDLAHFPPALCSLTSVFA